jgi:hypothetical protein
VDGTGSVQCSIEVFAISGVETLVSSTRGLGK